MGRAGIRSVRALPGAQVRHSRSWRERRDGRRLPSRAAGARSRGASRRAWHRSGSALRAVARRHDRHVAGDARARAADRARPGQHLAPPGRRRHGGAADGRLARWDGADRGRRDEPLLLAKVAGVAVARRRHGSPDAACDESGGIRGVLCSDPRSRHDGRARANSRPGAGNLRRSRRLDAVERPQRPAGNAHSRRPRGSPARGASLEYRNATRVLRRCRRVPPAGRFASRGRRAYPSGSARRCARGPRRRGDDAAHRGFPGAHHDLCLGHRLDPTRARHPHASSARSGDDGVARPVGRSSGSM